MKCPHCQTEFHDNTKVVDLNSDADAYWYLELQTCPACRRYVLQLVAKGIAKFQGIASAPGAEQKRYLVRPKIAARPSPPSEVPADFAQDYVEAALVIGDSAKASAALSRRCLQHLLRDKAAVKPSDLASEIDQVIASGKLPTHLAEAIDAVRVIGNFAAHPIKSKASGEVLPVEPGEAEWILDVLDGLFDFYFVQPGVLAKKRAALNAKLAEAKKPPVK